MIFPLLLEAFLASVAWVCESDDDSDVVKEDFLGGNCFLGGVGDRLFLFLFSELVEDGDEPFDRDRL